MARIESGAVYGPYVVLRDSGKMSAYGPLYVVRCICGLEYRKNSTTLCVAKKTKGCRVCKGGRPIPDLVGLKFGRLTVLRQEGRIGEHRAWICRCDCGSVIPLRTVEIARPRFDDPTRFTVESCGCLVEEWRAQVWGAARERKAAEKAERERWLAEHPSRKHVLRREVKWPLDPDIEMMTDISRQRKLQIQWHRDGRCVICGKPAAPGLNREFSFYCEKHNPYNRRMRR